MTNPFYEQGWRIPTPHQVLGILMCASIAIPILGITPDGSLGTKICQLLALLCGGTGIQAAKNYLSPQVLSKLQAVDARAFMPAQSTNVYAAPGTDIHVTPEGIEKP